MLFAAILDLATVLMTLLMIFGLLLIVIILLQKGRGGGLAGAFGGAGGQSALGTKAGDVFTKITVVMAIIWVILAGVSGIATRASSGKYSGGKDAIIEGASTTDPEKESPILEDDKSEKSPFKTDIPEAPAKEEKTESAKPVETPAPESKKADKKQEAPAKPEATKAETTKPETKPN
ncbi:preprotein translocase subunit SecG [uncultured Gimesia sp.]|uniref:preprotein translocase subunit SecG n=1 Tax=uncultured Gimesia sp. TaxID=1678688 RepID=UPI0030DD71AE|tara:strand:- start:48429 stop:48959 length:531 start_codon:yes stop_codon:yes gene_type:complete